MRGAVFVYGRVFGTKLARILDVLENATRQAGNSANRCPSGHLVIPATCRPPVCPQGAADHVDSELPLPAHKLLVRTCGHDTARQSGRSALRRRLSGVPDVCRPWQSEVGLAARGVPSCVQVPSHLLPRRADVVFPVRSRRSTRRVLGCS
jgi:hypothetical protein